MPAGHCYNAHAGAGGNPGDPGGDDPGKGGKTPKDRGDKDPKDPRDPKTPGRSSKKVPASFVEVIDCLVDLVLRFEGPYKKAEEGEQSMHLLPLFQAHAMGSGCCCC